MRKILYIISVLMLIVINYSCTEGLPDEQFEKLVLLTKNGWIDQKVDLSSISSGSVEIPVVVSISGTSTNAQNVSVDLDFDAEGLALYNFDKYKEQTGLYYTLIPADVISIENSSLEIEAKKDQGLTTLKLDLSKIEDKYQDYVIPIQITNVSKYALASSDYTNALYHLELKNNFSGNYSGGITVYMTKGNAEFNDVDQKVTIANKALYALSDTMSYFYAGPINRSSANRDYYIINAIYSNDTLSLESPNPALDLVPESILMTVSKKQNSSDHRYEDVTTTLDMTYKFTDISSDRLRAQGLVSMTQSVLIQD